ncbi:mucin-2 isoform X2 [Phlebotomus argentipes]|uniref:mucin-2 isoform X2 n=1 Tax=Phlebotomus argentipes TaxID=94469 RepID=UPI002892C5A0|nr:mucin-2 isoform X2 [Phlebotomus argentipes]
MAIYESQMFLHVIWSVLLITIATATPPDLSSLTAHEKPELSEHLSAVIGEDVAKSIEYKRQAEVAPLTTPKSRIQIKTAPNGVDYEYEYVYYYYDDDEDANRTTTRNRYQTIERTTKPFEMGNSLSKGEKERLPSSTRFPPRHGESNKSSEIAVVKVKHPSLDLVDSDTFNTADNRNLYATPSNDDPMEKVAFDLYVILQNEMMAAEITNTTTEEDETTIEVTTEAETTTEATTTTVTQRTTEVVVESRPAASRNRFKLRPVTTTSTTDVIPAKSRYGAGKPPASRANSFGRTFSTTEPSTTTVFERPSFGTRGIRTRNRFNLRHTTETVFTGETSTKAPRQRATFSSRSRSRPTTALSEESSTTTTTKPRVALPSRFLSPRKSLLLRTTTLPIETSENQEDNDAHHTEKIVISSTVSSIQESTTSQSGIHRLKNRPRIHVHSAERSKGATQNVFANRKVNPLIARRQFGLNSSTSEIEDDSPEDLNEAVADELLVTDQPTSEQPRGLGLLGARRKLPLRRPGTIFSAAP